MIVACVIGDGEAETGPLATAWHSNKFLNPVTDGAVLPILHLNGYKIANPTILARIPQEELEQLFRGYGWTPYFVEGDDPAKMHHADGRHARRGHRRDSARSRQDARDNGSHATRPRWPMIVLQTPKGWTGPKVVDGQPVEGTFRAHQVPLSDPAKNPEHLKQLEEWLQELQAGGTVRRRRHAQARNLQELAPERRPRAWAPIPTPTAACCCATCACPTSATMPSTCPRPARSNAEDTRVLGEFLRDVIKLNQDQRNFRIFGPDETLSNRLERRLRSDQPAVGRRHRTER